MAQDLRENEFWCDVQVLISHADIAVAQRLLSRLTTMEARSKAMRGAHVRVRCRLHEDGSIELAGVPGD